MELSVSYTDSSRFSAFVGPQSCGGRPLGDAAVFNSSMFLLVVPHNYFCKYLLSHIHVNTILHIL